MNVEVPESREKFRGHFLDFLMNNKNYKNRENLEVENLDSFRYHNGSLANLINPEGDKYDKSSTKLGFETVKKANDVEKHEYLSRIDDIDLEIKPEKDPSFYYYKRYSLNNLKMDLDNISMGLHVY